MSTSSSCGFSSTGGSASVSYKFKKFILTSKENVAKENHLPQIDFKEIKKIKIE